MSDKYLNDSEEGKFLPGQSREHPFAAPPGYFETLADRIMARIEVEEELSQFGLLSELRDKKLFDVPENYFQSAENGLESEYELAAFRELDKIKKPVLENAVDEEYFVALDKKMTGRLEVADELKEYELLHSIEKKNNFAFSADYFEALADRVKERKYAEADKASVFAKIISYIAKPKIAFAYSIVFIIGAGLLLYNFQPGVKVGPAGDCHTLACLEKNELLNEKNIRDFDDDNLYEMVDVDELNKQISSDSTTVADSVSNKNRGDSVIKNNN